MWPERLSGQYSVQPSTARKHDFVDGFFLHHQILMRYIDIHCYIFTCTITYRRDPHRLLSIIHSKNPRAYVNNPQYKIFLLHQDNCLKRKQ